MKGSADSFGIFLRAVALFVLLMADTMPNAPLLFAVSFLAGEKSARYCNHLIESEVPQVY